MGNAVRGLKIKIHEFWFEIYLDGNLLLEANGTMTVQELITILSKLNVIYTLEFYPEPNFDVSGI